MFDPEGTTERFLLTLNRWFSFGNAQQVAEFSAHIGWSLAVPAMAAALLPFVAFLWVTAVWVLYGLVKEALVDGHLTRLISEGHDQDLKDGYTDVLARTVPALLFLAVVLLRR